MAISRKSDCYFEYRKEGDKHLWQISSNKIELGLCLDEGRPLEVISLKDKSTEADYACACEINEVASGLAYKGHHVNDSEDGSLECVIVVNDEKNAIDVECHYIVFSDTAVIEKWIEVVNVSNEAGFKADGSFLSARLALAWENIEQSSMHYVNGMCGPSSDSRLQSLKVIEEKLAKGMAKELINSSMHSGEEYLPWVVLKDTVGKQGIYFGLEWSGPWRMDIKTGDDRIVFQTGIDNAFYHTLLAGERLASAKSFFGLFSGELDNAGANVQEFQRKHLMPAAPKGYEDTWPPVIYNNWPWTATHINEELIREQIELAVELGVEAFCVDYGWSNSPGDKRVNTKRFPGGMKALSDYARSKGLKFGLWLSPADYDPVAIDDKNAKDWAVLDKDKKAITFDSTCIGEYSGPYKGCLASDYKEYVKTKFDRIITEYKLTYLVYDQAMFYRCYSAKHHHQNAEDAWYYQVRGFYEILDYLLDKHPDLYIANQQGGGRIWDYGILRRSHVCAMHDNAETDKNRRYLYGATFPFVREYCLRSFTNQIFTDSPNYNYICRSIMMGVFLVGLDLRNLCADGMEKLRHNLAFYKEKIRPLKGYIYHLLPQPMDEDWDAVQLFDPATGCGAIFAFRRCGTTEKITLKLKRLDEMTWYNFSRINRQHRGEPYMIRGLELMKEGIEARLISAPSSQILSMSPLRKDECDYLNGKYPPREKYEAEDN
ncbi:MAG: glycoside hydrolase family 36 protein [Planctomycetota bacterium]